jgi:hypothetical protein
MAICKWCGRHYRSVYAAENDVGGYCCDKCRKEAQEAKANSDEGHYNHGCFSLKLIIWLFIALLAAFIYSNYIKDSNSNSKKTKSNSTTIYNDKQETKKDFKPQGTASNNTSSVTNQNVVIDGSLLRLRLEPSMEAETFKWKDGTNRHPKVGEKFKYIGESSEFYQIDFHGHQLWVSKQYTHLE